MSWTEHANFFTLTANRDQPIREGVIKLWVKLIDDIIPLNYGVDWDYIRIEYWEDSGRLIAIPASSQINSRIEKYGCQVVFPQLQEKYRELLDASDEQFDEEETMISHSIIEDIANAYKEKPLLNVLVKIYSADDPDPIRILSS